MDHKGPTDIMGKRVLSSNKCGKCGGKEAKPVFITTGFLCTINIFIYTVAPQSTLLTQPSVCVGSGGIDATVPQLMITKPHCSGASPKSKVSQNIFWQILRFTENSHYGLFLIFNIKQFLQDAVFVKVLVTGERGKA